MLVCVKVEKSGKYNYVAIMLLLVKCCDNKMVKLPRGFSCRSSSMRLTKNKEKNCQVLEHSTNFYLKLMMILIFLQALVVIGTVGGNHLVKHFDDSAFTFKSVIGILDWFVKASFTSFGQCSFSCSFFTFNNSKIKKFTKRGI